MIGHLLFLVLVNSVNGQGCAELQASDLGSTTGTSNVGLLADTIAAEEGIANPIVQILEINTVCLAQSGVRDTYESTSVVVRYMRMTRVRGPGEISEEVTGQVEYACSDGTWAFNVARIDTNPMADLATQLTRSCISCLSPVENPAVSTLQHCLG